MYKSVRIQNFRGFEDLTVDGLTRVNLIVGANNVGKTALLEAIGVIGNAPRTQPLFIMNTWRKLPMTAENSIGQIFQTIFKDGDWRRGAHLYGITALDQVHDVHIEVTETQTDSATLASGSSSDQQRFLRQDRLTIHLLLDGHETTGNAWLTHGATRVEFDDADALLSEAVFIPSHMTTGADNDAKRLSDVARARQTATVIKNLRIIEPRLVDLQVLDTGAGPGIYVDIGAEGLTPLGLLGSGTVRLLSILLAASTVQGGLLALDDMDEGLYYTVLADVWRGLGGLAQRTDCQLFATTHSYECMTAAYEAFADCPEDLSIHRLERRNDGTIVSKDFGHETLGVALKRGFEVR